MTTKRKTQSDPHKWMRHFPYGDILVPACRYYLGRMTIATHTFAEALYKAWPELDESVRDVIMNDIDKAFKDDDRDREMDMHGVKRLGHDMDRKVWEKVRSRWAYVPFGGFLKQFKECHESGKVHPSADGTFDCWKAKGRCASKHCRKVHGV